ncbi:MAG TPA: DUF4398 domain-containing protein [Bdellovibrionota bacterium]|nr:DUF4398 domain-containing protein [Bdellovibrionota bacterium]
MNWKFATCVGAYAVILLGCSHARPPTDILSTAEATLREAEKPETMSAAPLDVQMAKEKLEKAKKAMSDEEYDQARRMAEQAMVDAQVAQSKGAADKSKRLSEEASKTMETLRKESSRGITQ